MTPNTSATQTAVGFALKPHEKNNTSTSMQSSKHKLQHDESEVSPFQAHWLNAFGERSTSQNSAKRSDLRTDGTAKTRDKVNASKASRHLSSDRRKQQRGK